MRSSLCLCRDIDQLDEELLNTAVDPALLHRTVETSRRHHVKRARSRSDNITIVRRWKLNSWLQVPGGQGQVAPGPAT
jgi:hypothetical protein